MSSLEDFLPVGPDVSKEYILSVLSLAEGLGFKIEVDRAGKSIGNNEWRGSQIVGPGVRVNTAFEVTVS